VNCYIHTPFCNGRCGYCAFFSDGAPTEEKVRLWLAHLCCQLDALPRNSCDTIYLGGGTPTLPGVPVLTELFCHVLPLAREGCEISMEANPETLTAEKVAFLRERITRISLGVQSFDGELRRILGRNCSDAALENALKWIQSARFPHWNIDLIYGIPGQTPEAWRRELQHAVSLGCDHLSCYNLTPEEGARLADKMIPDEEDSVAMWKMAGAELAQAGIYRYEISNYARPGAECRHNVSVWRGGELWGLGPSAAGFDGRVRRTQVPSLDRWLAGEPPETDALSVPDRCREIFAVNLRTTSGWTPELWAQVPGAEPWAERVERTRRIAVRFPDGFLNVRPDRIFAGENGLLFWNDVAEALL